MEYDDTRLRVSDGELKLEGRSDSHFDTGTDLYPLIKVMEAATRQLKRGNTEHETRMAVDHRTPA